MNKRDESYTVKMVLGEMELGVLKKALKAYKGACKITEDLLGIIERQEEIQNENRNNKSMPMVGQTVWVIYGDELFREKVYALGKYSFFVESCKDPSIKVDFWEWLYDGYGVAWFYSEEEAKECLLARYSDDYELVQHNRTWYGVRRL